MKFVISFHSIYVENYRLVYSRFKRHIYAWLFLVRHLTWFDCMKVAQQNICGSYYTFSYLQFLFSSSFSCFWFKSVLSLKAELMSYCILSIFYSTEIQNSYWLYHTKCMKTSQSCKMEGSSCMHWEAPFPPLFSMFLYRNSY